ncbi:uncharacterized protein LOC125486257 [Rhincodon typus]|uniref:uncharacterized protein LOC125486257 n=1 Tax=Rhincodon typus TaxID=259920 RepID=UPI00202F470D|nr:uncharacterized protein LOC125486257 [Rhincodon typus]
MEADSDSFPVEYMKGVSGELILDSAENISSNISYAAGGPGSLQAVVYAMNSAKVEVSDSTVADSQKNCCTEKAQPDCSQRMKELTSVFVGCGSWEEQELNVKGLMSEYAHEEPGLETSRQWEKERTNVEIGPPETQKAGVYGRCGNGVLAVYYDLSLGIILNSFQQGAINNQQLVGKLSVSVQYHSFHNCRAEKKIVFTTSYIQTSVVVVHSASGV